MRRTFQVRFKKKTLIYAQVVLKASEIVLQASNSCDAEGKKMKCLGLVLVFALIGGMLALQNRETNDCLQRSRRKDDCAIFLYKEPAIGWPEDKEEMDLMCRNGMDYLSCVDNSYKVCNAEDDRDALKVRNLLSYAEKDLCNQESQSHNVIASNGNCIKRTLSTAKTECGPGGTLPEKHKTIISGMGSKAFEDEVFKKDPSCVHSVIGIACVADCLEASCGKEVGAAYVDILSRYRQIGGECPTEFFSQIVTAAVDALRTAAKG